MLLNLWIAHSTLNGDNIDMSLLYFFLVEKITNDSGTTQLPTLLYDMRMKKKIGLIVLLHVWQLCDFGFLCFICANCTRKLLLQGGLVAQCQSSLIYAKQVTSVKKSNDILTSDLIVTIRVLGESN